MIKKKIVQLHNDFHAFHIFFVVWKNEVQFFLFSASKESKLQTSNCLLKLKKKKMKA